MRPTPSGPIDGAEENVNTFCTRRTDRRSDNKLVVMNNWKRVRFVSSVTIVKAFELALSVNGHFPRLTFYI